MKKPNLGVEPAMGTTRVVYFYRFMNLKPSIAHTGTYVAVKFSSDSLVVFTGPFGWPGGSGNAMPRPEVDTYSISGRRCRFLGFNR